MASRPRRHPGRRWQAPAPPARPVCRCASQADRGRRSGPAGGRARRTGGFGAYEHEDDGEPLFDTTMKEEPILELDPKKVKVFIHRDRKQTSEEHSEGFDGVK